MKEIIKQVLAEQVDKSKIVPATESETKLKHWLRQGLVPVMIDDRDVDEFELVVLERPYNSGADRRYGDIRPIYLLTQEQYEHAKTFFDRIDNIYKKYLDQLNNLKELFKATLVQNIMNNKFPSQNVPK